MKNNNRFTAIIMAIIFVALIVINMATCTGSNNGGKNLNSAEALKDYLDNQPANSSDKPIKITMSVNEPMIEKITAVITSAGKYVNLNLSGSSLTIIPKNAFYDEKTEKGCAMLISVTIPSSVTSIADFAFRDCTGLSSVNTGDNVTSIGEGVFFGCTSLTSINIGNNVTNIGEGAFASCTSLTSITVPNNNTTIADNAFFNTYLTSITIGTGNNVIKIGDGAFVGNIGPGGGKVFYYNSAGFTMTDNNEICHYLEAAPTDMPTSLAWSSRDYRNTEISGTETAIGTGRKNTALILVTDVNAPASKACKGYNNNGKTDWFLPSQVELNEMNKVRTFIGNMGTEWYWSSSQSSRYSDTAVIQRFNDGVLGDYAKSFSSNVRAIRAF